MRIEEITALARVVDEVSASQVRNRWREQEMGYREMLIAERDGQIVGTVSIGETDEGRSMHLFALEVATSQRSQGIGGEIVRYVVDEARRRGCKRVYLEVRADNPARRLYHRLGFRRVGSAFTNAWWRFEDDGSQERVEELSYLMARRVR
jgi:ribosomal protein S18 acetylase RimI-like enzyme